SPKFVPSLGSWAKPLFFKPPVTPSESSTPRDYDPAAFSPILMGCKVRSCLQPVSEAVPELPSTLSNASMDCQGTPVTMFTSISSSSHVQKKNQAASPNSLNTLPILVDSHSTPTITPAMEFSPSNIIYNEVQGSLVVDLLITSPKISGFEIVDEIETKLSNSLSLIRGGREAKLSIKYQDIEWKTVRERGKYSRRGRGSYR
ncbi:hypothetical protein HID58_053029, partial [Brassica napus]